MGVGHIQSLAPEDEQKSAANTNDGKGDEGKEGEAAMAEEGKSPGGASFFEGKAMAPPDVEADEPKVADTVSDAAASSSQGTAPAAPKSWAMLVNPFAASAAPPASTIVSDGKNPAPLKVQFAPDAEEDAADLGGQFDDADEDDSEDDDLSSDDDDEEGERYANISDPEDFSDEECDVYILDPEEVEERKRQKEEQKQEDAAGDLADELAAARLARTELAGLKDGAHRRRRR